MSGIAQLTTKLESAARPVIRRMRSVCPGALRTLGLPTGVYETTDDWARETGEKLLLVHQEPRTTWIHAPARHLPGREHPGFPESVGYGDLRTFVARMRDARVTGRNGFVIASTGKVLGDLPKVYRAHYTPPTHPLLNLVKPPTVERLPGVSAELAIYSVNNYYHWMFEALPRLELLRQAGFSLEGIDWLIVNATDNQFVKQSLAYFGIPESKLHVSRDGHAYQCAELLAPSMPGQTNPSKWICEFLRQHLLPRSAAASETTRLFVSRAPGGRRRIVNESEVEALLAQRGFRKVYLEACTLEEQIALFSSAEAVIAAHGASMANLVFCPPGAKAIEVFSPEYVNACYRGVAVQVGLEYGYLIGEGNFSGILQNMAHVADDIRVKIDELRQLLDLLAL